MPPIKLTSLNRLIELFGQTVNNLPPGPVRSLAAQLMTLSGHVIRVDQKVDTRVKELGEQISTLADMVQELVQRQGGAAPAPTATADAPKGAAPAVPAEAEQEEPTPDEEFEARFRAEAEAEIAAANGAPEVVGVQ